MDDEGWGRLLADVTGRHAADVSADEVTAMRVVLVDAMVDWAMPAAEKAAFLAQFDTLVAEVRRLRAEVARLEGRATQAEGALDDQMSLLMGDEWETDL